MNFNQKKDLKSAMEQVRIINSLEERIRNFEPEDFQNATRNFKIRLFNGETHRDILPEAFAVCREASAKTALDEAQKDLEDKQADYNEKLNAYADSLAAYTVAKSDYDEFVNAEKKAEEARKEAAAKVAAMNKSKAPKTGDSTDLDLAALGLAGAAAALAASRKKKTER